MRKFYRLLSIGFLITVSGICVSCVDTDYDFNKLDPEITVGGENLKINIGSTKQFRLGDIVSSFGGLSSGDDGSYGVSISTDPVNVSLEGIKQIKANVSVDHGNSTLSDISVFIDTVPQFEDAELAAMPEEIDLSDLILQTSESFPPSQELSIKFKGMPKEIVSLSDVKLSDGAKLRVSISAPDCILTGGSIIPDCTVDLSRLFEVGNDGGVQFSGDELTPENGFKVVRDFPLKRLLLSPGAFDAATRTVTLTENVSVSGKIHLKSPKTTKTRYSQVGKDIKLRIDVDVIDLTVASITGGFQYSVSNLQTTFTLGGLFGGFDFESAVLDFSNPTLDLVVDTNLGVPVKADIEFVPIKGGNELDTRVLSAIEIPAVQDPSKPEKSIYRFSKSGDSSVGITGVKADLPSLLRSLPDVVKINIAANTDKDADGTVELGRSYEMTVTMDVNVPMSFGKDLKIDYRDTIRFNASGVESLLNSNTLALGGLLDNSMPLNYMLSVDLVDSEYQPVAATMAQEVKANSKTALNMELKKDASSSSSPMAALILCFSLSSGSDNARLNADNYIQASDLTLGLPGGFTFRFGK